MRNIPINSMYHYEIIPKEGDLVLIEYEAPLCPHEKDDEKLDRELHGAEVAQWPAKDPVQFQFDSSCLIDPDPEPYILSSHPVLPTEGIMCGDDMQYHLREKA